MSQSWIMLHKGSNRTWQTLQVVLIKSQKRRFLTYKVYIFNTYKHTNIQK